MKCDGLLYDLLRRVPLSVLKVSKIWLPWLLIYTRFYKMFNVTDGGDKFCLVLTLDYTFAISILTAWTHLILL